MKNKQEGKGTRRDFIKKSAAGAAWLGTLPLWEDPLIKNTLRKKEIHGVCYHDCPDACSWKVTTTDGNVTSFRANEEHPFTNGWLCHKMEDFPGIVTYHPDRILTPMKRTGPKGAGQFVPVSWEEAIEDISGKLKKIIRDSNAEAILPFSFAGTEGLVQIGAIPYAFFDLLGASRLNRSICGDAAVEGVLRTTGSTTGVLPEDIIHSRYIILWGTNTVTSNQHLWPFIEKARAEGARLVVIDPFQSHTAEKADWHIRPLPGTDVVLALSMMHVLFSEDLIDYSYVEKHTEGAAELKEYVRAYSPEVAEGITGIPAADIIRLSREYAGEKVSLVRFLIGMEHQANGANAFRAISMLPALTGAWKYLGGGFMHMTYELFGKALNHSWKEKVAEAAPTGTREINMVQLGRALNDPELRPRVEALIVFNSNPAVIVPDQNQVLKGLAREDLFTVVVDHFVTDTARYADYFLPATTQLEHWDLLTSWGQPYLAINEPAIRPMGESLPNSEIFRRLADAMGMKHACFKDSDLELIRSALDSEDPLLEGIDLAYLRKNGWAKLRVPEPWMPFKDGAFHTRSGKCILFDAGTEDPVPVYRTRNRTEEDVKNYPLQLLTVKSTLHFLNSSHANVSRLRTEEGPPQLDMHPDDARSRAILDSQMVKVHNERGEIILQVRVDEKVAPGVVCMPQGYWPMLTEGGRTANALTPDTLTDMGGGGAFHENFVQVLAAR